MSWRDWFRKSPEPLRGAPAVHRLKTYSAESGYAIQYFYDGFRDVGEGTLFVFSISADRKTFSPVSILVPPAAYRAWEQSHQRRLAGNEIYAIAKLALLGQFDRHAPPELANREYRVNEADVLEILERLDL